MKKLFILSLVSVLIFSCSNSDNKSKSQESNNKQLSKVAEKGKDTPKVQDDGHNHNNQLGVDLIKADDMYSNMLQGRKFYVFDVRTDLEYQKGHIKKSLSKPLRSIDSSVKKEIPLSSEIITYCGCPHHLSSMGAKKLEDLGYTDVKVLDEGYWVWKEKGYPVIENPDAKISKLTVEGKLVKNNKPISNENILLVHSKTGQMEATMTDKDGNYQMNFHLYNYQNNDEFNFFVKDLKEKSVQNFSTNSKVERDVIVNLS